MTPHGSSMRGQMFVFVNFRRLSEAVGGRHRKTSGFDWPAKWDEKGLARWLKQKRPPPTTHPCFLDLLF
jgi:hypothetical protein